MKLRIFSVIDLRVLIAIAALALPACGGGGGGGSDAPPSSAPQPPSLPDSTYGTLVINEDNAPLIALNLALTEVLMQFAQMIANTSLIFGSAMGSPDVACRGGGNIQIDFSDNDSSFDVSTGDHFTLYFSNCYNELLDGNLDGRVSVEVQDYAVDSSTGRFSGTAVTPAPLVVSDSDGQFPPFTIDTSINIVFSSGETDVIQITPSSTGESFLFTQGSITERIHTFEFVKTAINRSPYASPPDIDTELALSNKYESEFLEGSFTCETTKFRHKNLSWRPVEAEILCRGMDNTAVRLSNIDRVDLDTRGNGEFEALGILQWSEVVTGFFAAGSGLSVADISGPLEIRNLELHSTYLAHDPLRNRTLITTSSDDPHFPNALLAFSTVDERLTLILTFASEPERIRISNDGSRVYVNVANSQAILRFDPSTDEIIDQINIEHGRIIDFAISPMDADSVAVGYQVPGSWPDIVIVTGSKYLPNSLRDTGVLSNFNSLVFSSSGQRVFAAGNSGVVMDIDVDGISNAFPLYIGFSSPLHSHGGLIYAGSRVFDETDIVRIGAYRNAYAGAFAVDLNRNRVFSVYNDILSVHHRDHFVQLSSYSLNLPGDAGLSQVVPAGDLLLIRDRTRIRIVEQSDIEVLNTSECTHGTETTEGNGAFDRYACPIRSAVYDPVRNRIYAIVSGSLGRNGNSVAVINPDTKAIENYIFVGPEPRDLAISPGFDRLNVIFFDAEKIVTVNLNSLQITREILMENETSTAGDVARPQVLALTTYPAEPDTFIVAIGEQTSTPFSKYVLYRDGTRLEEYISKSDMVNFDSVPQQRAICSAGGSCFSIGNKDRTAELQAIDVGSNGLFAGYAFSADPVLFSYGRADFYGQYLITDAGGSIDTANALGEEHFDLASADIANRETAYAVKNDSFNNETYFLVSSDAYRFSVARFNRQTGKFLSKDIFNGENSHFFTPSLFEVESDKIGVVVGASSGLIVFEKSILQ